eukprot:TRINITY_DN26832_c0_g1_i1.p1 TRINITY_DN26832_c0_g1~~TRINITY_DN26832_c0_g1_i1.p1  ORF type:complete len:485 (+),score=158.17 TRINITY_DN26832_c0_g1_i1:57-1457(+)
MGIVLSHHTEFSSVANDSSGMRAAVTLSGEKSREAGGQNQEASLVVVVDRSHSMKEAGRMDAVKESLRLLLENNVDNMVLGSRDRLGIVMYNEKAEVVLPLTKMDDDGKGLARDAIDSMTPSGRTNIEEGLTLGVEEILKGVPCGSTSGEVNHAVWLFTDGAANEGIRNRAEMAQHITKINPNRTVGISTFEYGYDCGKEELLQTIAQAGNGDFHQIEEATAKDQKVELDFATAIATLLSVVALNITMEVKLSPGVTFSSDILDNFAGDNVEVSPDKSTLTLFVKDIIEEQRRTFIIAVDLPSAPVGDFSVGDITVKYYATAKKQWETEVRPIMVKRLPDPPKMDLNFLAAEITNYTSKSFSKASQMASRDNVSGAKDALSEGISFVSMKKADNKSISVHAQSSHTIDMSLMDMEKALQLVEAGDLRKANGGIKRMQEPWRTQRSIGPGTSFQTTSQAAIQDSVRN